MLRHLNYDTILEDAMSQVLHLQVQDPNSYITWSNYSLFKLHGSINWGLEVHDIAHPGNNIPYPYQNLIDMITPGSSHLTTRYWLCNREMLPTDRAVVVFPALSIPVENKDEFSCPPEHVTALEGMLPNVTKMIPIGWRATEAEFLQKLKSSRLLPRAGIRNQINLLVVTGSQDGAEQTLRNLTNVGGTSSDHFREREPVSTGFTGLIRNSETLEVFLRAS